MLPLKEKSILGPTKIVTMSKFKVYSDVSKVNGLDRCNVGTNSLRTFTLLKKDSLLSSKSTSKGKDLKTVDDESRVRHSVLGKTKLGRKALADVSNIRPNSYRVEKAGSLKNSMISATTTSTAISNHPPVGKVTASAAGASSSKISVRLSTKTTRTTFNFGRAETVHTMTRKNTTNSRNSFPSMKKTIQLGSGDLHSQGDIKSAEKSSRKTGFPVKTRIDGVRHLKPNVTKDRSSDGFMGILHRNKTSTDALQGLKKSLKPSSRITLQTSIAHRNSKSKIRNSLYKPIGVSSAIRVKVATSSIPGTLKSVVTQKEAIKGANTGKDSDNKEPQMLKATFSRKSTRRKSFTSVLMSRSKRIEAEKEEKLPNIDDKGNPMDVAEYVDDIFQYYWTVEVQSTSLENYMMIQKNITPQMRSILINWLIEVHFKYDLMPETLYLAVALLDRYLSLVSITKGELQLIGLTSLLLASKYEDFWHPRVKDLISISGESYTRKQILEREKDILKKLKFRMNLPTAYMFMLRFLKASMSEKKVEHLAFYLIELCLIDYEALKFRPSLLCASAVYVARCTLNKLPAWTPLLQKHAHYNETQIRECSQKIWSIHKAASSSLLKVTHDKYNRPGFGKVTSVQPLAGLP